MGITVTQPELSDILAQLSRRIDTLETGGKPMLGLTASGSLSITLAAGVDSTAIGSTISWTNPNVTAPMNGIPYLALYVDTDNVATHLWPVGTSLTSGQRNVDFRWFLDQRYLSQFNNQTRTRIYLKNNDSGSHTYYLYIQWIFMQGGSGSSGV